MNTNVLEQTAIPESIKSLFRNVACTIPDEELICAVALASDGFLNSKVNPLEIFRELGNIVHTITTYLFLMILLQLLARKVTGLYHFAREQLSKQYHYDWGLRSIVATLKMAANLRRASPKLSETVVVLRALRDMNLSKLVGEDSSLFYGLLRVCFPKFYGITKFSLKIAFAYYLCYSRFY